MHWSSSRIRPVRACMSVIRAPTPRWTSLRAKRRMQGYNVLYPMGWDAFGLPTENFAIKNHVHPAEVTKKNVARFKSQLKSLGLSFDWDARDQHHRPELLQVDPVDFPAAVQEGPGLQEGNGGQLVHLLQVRSGERRGRQRRLRALRQRGRPQGQEPVDAQASPSTHSA